MDPELGVIAAVENRGGAGAGAFVVTVNGTPYPHAGLAPAATGSLWAAGYRIDGPQSADVDTADQVAEGDEDNNVRSEMVPVPTLPICPTGTASPTPGGPTSPPRRTPGTVVPSATSRTPSTASTVTPESTSTGTSTATPRTTPSPEPTAAPGRSFLPFLGS